MNADGAPRNGGVSPRPSLAGAVPSPVRVYLALFSSDKDERDSRDPKGSWNLRPSLWFRLRRSASIRVHPRPVPCSVPSPRAPRLIPLSFFFSLSARRFFC